MKYTVAGFFGLIATLFAAAKPVFAWPVTQFAVCQQGVSNFLFLEPWYACVQDAGGTIKIDHLNDVWLIVLVIMDDALKLTAYIAVGFIIWGGIQYIKSQGEASNLSAAKDTIKNAVIGLIICLLSVALVQFIAGSISA